jgi:hypothetical protein
MTGAALDGLPADERWHVHPTVETVEQISRRTVRRKGTVTRYRVVTDDGIQRMVFHAQSLDRLRPSHRPFPLTMGTAAPLSLGPEGAVMHLALRTIERGLDVLVIGPERTDRDRTADTGSVEQVAARVAFPTTARAGHLIADHLTDVAGADLRHMLWTGISLGAMKGLHFAALAAEFGRTVVYGHFTVPVSPRPMPTPTASELRRFMRGEAPALARMAGELIVKDVRDRTLRIHQNIARLSDPWLVSRYLRSTPLDKEFRTFTEAWRRNVITGDAGHAARLLPTDRLNTIELYDRDRGGQPDDWRAVLGDRIDGPSLRMMVSRGRHTDAMRLTGQNRRAKLVWDVIDQIDRGVAVDELEHPLRHVPVDSVPDRR